MTCVCRKPHPKTPESAGLRCFAWRRWPDGFLVPADEMSSSLKTDSLTPIPLSECIRTAADRGRVISTWHDIQSPEASRLMGFLRVAYCVVPGTHQMWCLGLFLEIVPGFTAGSDMAARF